MEHYKVDLAQKWDYENGFYLTSNSTRIAKILAHYELYKSIINLPGQIVECGVFKGISLIRYAAFREVLENPYSRKIIGKGVSNAFFNWHSSMNTTCIYQYNCSFLGGANLLS